MCAFANWYLALLKSHPMMANTSAAALLMSVGDAIAQSIQLSRSHDGQQEMPPKMDAKTTKPDLIAASLMDQAVAAAASSPPTQRRKRTNGLRRHATLSPNLEVAHCDYGITRLEWESPTVLDAAIPDTAWQGLRLDGARIGTMAVWSGAVQAPVVLMLYRFYDRILPAAITPYAVGSRVALSFLSSIPLSTAFFGYGTVVNHLLHSCDDTRQEFVFKDAKVEESFFWTTVGDQIQKKWSNDLSSTLSTAAKVWMPFNAVNFSLVPPHLRPLSMMVVSAGWNCHLSFVQHASSDDHKKA